MKAALIVYRDGYTLLNINVTINIKQTFQIMDDILTVDCKSIYNIDKIEKFYKKKFQVLSKFSIPEKSLRMFITNHKKYNVSSKTKHTMRGEEKYLIVIHRIFLFIEISNTQHKAKTIHITFFK